MSLKNLSDKKLLPYLEEDAGRSYLVVMDMKLAAYLHAVGMTVGKTEKFLSTDSKKPRTRFYMVDSKDRSPDTLLVLLNSFYQDKVSQKSDTESGDVRIEVQPYHVLRSYAKIRDMTVAQQGDAPRGDKP